MMFRMNSKSLLIIKRNTSSIVAGLICLIILFIILIIPNNTKSSEPTELSEYSSVSTICELATLRCFYHDVAMYSEDKSGDATVTNVFIWPFNL